MTDPKIETTIIAPPDYDALLHQALIQLSAPPPSAKGMDPVTRANMLRREIERRADIAKKALTYAR